MTQTYCFKVDKLIRDKLPQIMRASGIQVFEQVIDQAEYQHQLKNKLLEEAHEVLASSSEKEVREELADILEVMMALAREYDLELADIQETAAQKRVEKGGFDDKIYVHHVQIAHDSPALALYRAHPEKYPEITTEIGWNKGRKSD